VVNGIYADGTVRDLTQFADFKVDGDAAVTIDEERFVTAKKNGAGTLTVSAGGVSVKVRSSCRISTSHSPSASAMT